VSLVDSDRIFTHHDATIQKPKTDENAPLMPKVNYCGQAGKAVFVEVDDLLDNQVIIA
jgi:hypothetical protein